MKKIILLALLCLFITIKSFSANSFSRSVDTVKAIEIGGQCPDLIFKNVTNSPQKTIRLSDYRGKLLILDFWATWCAPCIGAMPKNNMLQKQFGDKIMILGVDDESKETVDAFFSNSKRLRGLDMHLTSLYGDNTLRAYFPHITIPHCVWIDANGKVIAITNGYDLTAQNIQKVLDKGQISIDDKTDRKRLNIDKPFFNEGLKKPLFVHEGTYGDQKIKYRSVLTEDIDNLSSGTMFFTGRIITCSGSILSLTGTAYSYSFSNKLETFYKNRMILEVKDPSRYLEPVDQHERNIWYKSNIYVYDQVLPDYYKGPVLADGPDSIRKYACEIMKKDIASFSGLHSGIEKRKVSCLVLRCLDSTKVNSKEDFGATMAVPGHLGAVFHYPNTDWLMRSLKLLYQDKEPLIDDTNYTGPVNIKIDALLTDRDALNAELRKFGLEMIKEDRMIDMLVVKDH